MNKLFLLLIMVLVMVGCGKKAQYDRLVERELASGVRNDSLFFGIYFGMTSKEFYTHCWELNKEGLIRQGDHNLSVEHQFKGLDHTAKMNFYPNFYEDRIYEMPVKFQYNAWAPWNKHLWSDSLQMAVLELMEEWYGEGFMEVKHPEHGSAFVKVDGNRRITIFKKGESDVYTIFTDLTREQPAEEEKRLMKEEHAARNPLNFDKEEPASTN